MTFNSLHEADQWFMQYKPLDRQVPFFWTEYDWKPWKFGDWILFRHLKNNKEISRPVLGIYLDMTIWDQALVMEYVKPRRAWQYSNSYSYTVRDGSIYTAKIAFTDIQTEQIQFWTDNIEVLGRWTVKPSYRQLKEALS